MLSKSQQKGVSTGVSWYAIGQLLIVVVILVVWIRSVVRAFDRTGNHNIAPTLQVSNYFPTLTDQEIMIRNQEPTATPWIVSEGSGIVIGQNTTPSPTKSVTALPVELQPKPGEVQETPVPTETPWFTDIYIPGLPGLASMPGNVSGDPDQELEAKISYYWPPLAYEDPKYWINCDVTNGVPECEQMASGLYVRDWVGQVVACPVEYLYGTVFQIWGVLYVCEDRGGSISRIDSQNIWLDILYPSMPEGHYWGESTHVRIWLP